MFAVRGLGHCLVGRFSLRYRDSDRAERNRCRRRFHLLDTGARRAGGRQHRPRQPRRDRGRLRLHPQCLRSHQRRRRGGWATAGAAQPRRPAQTTTTAADEDRRQGLLEPLLRARLRLDRRASLLGPGLGEQGRSEGHGLHIHPQPGRRRHRRGEEGEGGPARRQEVQATDESHRQEEEVRPGRTQVVPSWQTGKEHPSLHRPGQGKALRPGAHIAVFTAKAPGGKPKSDSAAFRIVRP